MSLKIPQFDQAQVLVVGDVMLDRYWSGGTNRVSPEAPVPVVKVDNIEDRPGGAANVALNIAALGAGASIVGAIGVDEAGNILKESLGAVGVHCQFQENINSPTITKLRVISRNQQLLRLDFEEALTSKDISGIEGNVEARLSSVDILVLSDYAKGTLAGAPALIALAKKANVPVLVDPKGSDFTPYRGATLLTPNIHELEVVVGHCENEKTLVEKGLQLLADLEIQALLITRGEHGMTLLRAGKPELHLPARAREVFDVTGAGDTVISTLAAAMSAGEDIADAVVLANIAAGIVVGKLGTAAISGPELRRAIQAEHGAERGVMTAEQLVIAVQEYREAGEKIVMTNGCFDIIHAGHVGYLEEARALGDRLIVAVNNDDSVKRLKGSGRPINPVDRRMAVLAGLEAVDWVVSFSKDTPEELIAALKPEVLVKGGDYSIAEVVGGDIVKGYGGEVAVLTLLDDCSTTAIVDKIQKQ